MISQSAFGREQEFVEHFPHQVHIQRKTKMCSNTLTDHARCTTGRPVAYTTVFLVTARIDTQLQS